MVRSSSTSLVVETLLSLPQLSFEMANATLERPNVFLSGEVQLRGRPAESAIELALYATPESERSHDPGLNAGVLQKRDDPRVLHGFHQALFESAHG